MGIRKFNDEIELEICDKYLNRLSTYELGKEYNCSHSTISNILKRNNISFRSQSEAKRQYSLDESYFDVIDTEDKVYFLGLMYADGNNSNNRLKKSNEISIGLQEDDKEILEIFNRYLKSNRPLQYIPERIMKDKDGNFRYRKTDGLHMVSQSQYKLLSTSKKMSDALIRLGCVPAKSLILKFPTSEQVPEYLLPDFIRGYFDGDGCIYFNGDPNGHSNYSCSITMLGTEEFLIGVKNFLLKKGIESIGIYKINKKSKSNSWVLSIGNILDVLLFKKFIYDNYLNDNSNGDLYFQRKYNKFMEIKKYKNDNIKKIRHLYRLRIINRPENVFKIIKLYLEFNYTPKQIADNFKISSITVNNILKKNNIELRTKSEAQFLRQKNKKLNREQKNA